MNKLRAFTIMEVTISMLIAVIVIGTTYAAYDIINLSYKSYNSKNLELSNLTRLDLLIKKDFDNADCIIKTENGIMLNLKDQEVTYAFYPQFTIRYSGVNDTFKFVAQAINLSFARSPVESIDAYKQENNRVDQLDLIFTYAKEQINFHYHKLYSSVNLFQRL